ncbi:MAG: DUF2807 domain-containing protein [Acidobacteria bacterium]|nr:DUF2807 domain-containing protein [Acidobacteriota bacterium]
MKKIGIIIFVAAVAIGAVAANLSTLGRLPGNLFSFNLNFFGRGVKGSGVTGSERRDLSNFKGVDVGGVFQVEIVAQKDFSVEIEADDNLLKHIRTEVSGGVLEISSHKRLKTENPIRVRITAPLIEKIEASGASKVTVSELAASSLSVDTSGASRIVLAGESEQLSVDISGASGVEATELRVASADVDASGASTVNVNVSNRLTAEASGASTIGYLGNPANVQQKSSGAGKIVRR